MILEGVEIHAIRSGVDVSPLYGAGPWLSPCDVVYERLAGRKQAVTGDRVQRFLCSEADGAERVTVVFDRTRPPGDGNPALVRRPGLTGIARHVKQVLADEAAPIEGGAPCTS